MYYSVPIVTAASMVLLISTTHSHATTPNFQSLGDLAGGLNESVATAISADGSTVVGYSQTYLGRSAFRWTATSGMRNLGDLPGGQYYSYANDVSADGSLVVGNSIARDGTKAFRRTAEYGMQSFGSLTSSSWTTEASNARGVSADGSVIVGEGYINSILQPYRWTADNDPATDPPGGMVGLGVLPGGNIGSYALASSTSADGSIVVGGAYGSYGTEAYYWTEDTGMIGLGDLPGGDFYSAAHDISGDGSVIVGRSKTDAGSEAFIWTEQHGMRALQHVLTIDLGLDLSGWSLYSASGISDNGLTITGTGTNPAGNYEAFIVTLPEPGGLVAFIVALPVLLWGRDN